MTIKTTWSKPLYLFVGSYERELHWLWDTVEPAPNMTAWILGAAEGYYACGVAKKWRAKVMAYEASERSRTVLATNIALNGLEGQVTVCGKCEAREFRREVEDQAPNLLICDVEGAEDEIFSVDLVAALQHTTVVIELHPPYRSRSMGDAFADTHHVQFVNPVDRRLADYPYEDWIPEKLKLAWLDEGRPFATPWLVAIPRS